MKNWLLASVTTTAFMTSGAFAQTVDDEDIYEEMIIVTATRITQGGAQDIEFFRTSVEDGRLPAPGAITSEGLLSTHDMVLSRNAPCEQLFCLSVEAMKADMLAKPEATAFMGLGFATNIDTKSWERQPTTIMAVVDTSGSMYGEPLELAKASLRETLAQLRVGDRMGLAHYGADTALMIPISDVEMQRGAILNAINALESNGSTNMEAGLKFAFDTAHTAKKGFDGSTRVILFTDEQPNVGNTDAESFIGMARTASHDRIGLTTIGVADHFGADLANQLSAARGGNLFYATSDADVKQLFGTDFDFLVTEVAHDLTVKIKPRKGVEITEVFGLPGEGLRFKSSGATSFTIPSVFLSSKGGGIFLTLEGDISDNRTLADISLSYISAADNTKGGETLAVAGLTSSPSAAMKLGQLLSDEYKVLQRAAEADMFNGDRAAALALTRVFENNLATMGDAAPKGELELVTNVGNILEKKIENANINMAEAPEASSVKQLMADTGIYGAWKISRVKNTSTSITGKGSIDLRKGDLLAFNLDEDTYDETETFNARRLSARQGEPEFEVESMSIDQEARRITLHSSDIVFRYAKMGTRLKLYVEDTDLVLWLDRPPV